MVLTAGFTGVFFVTSFFFLLPPFFLPQLVLHPFAHQLSSPSFSKRYFQNQELLSIVLRWRLLGVALQKC